jgi:hypothetical protein
MEVYYTQEFNIQLLNTVDNSSTILTHVRTLLVFSHNCSLQLLHTASFLFRSQNTTDYYQALPSPAHCCFHSNVSVHTVSLLWKCHNSLSRNRHCYVAMEMLQTHCYATGTVTLLWKRHQRLNMSQYYPPIHT